MFIVFEGIDGSGKTTQIRHLMSRLKAAGHSCYQTKEPTDGPIGSLIRQLLTGRTSSANDQVLAALFAADRLDHLLNDTDGLIAKIDNGISVICDRYYLSSYAYHGTTVPLEWLINANSLSADILRPTCHIFIDIDPELAMERLNKARFHKEFYEAQEKLTKIRGKYLEAIDLLKDKENIILVDGNLDEIQLAEIIWQKIFVYTRRM